MGIRGIHLKVSSVVLSIIIHIKERGFFFLAHFNITIVSFGVSESLLGPEEFGY